MITKKIDYFDIEKIKDSGQCFRWKQISENTFCTVAFDRYLQVQKNGELFSFSCDEKEWQQIFASYFDMDTDYQAIENRIIAFDDAHLCEAYNKGRGIRILRQDLWEMIVSFMISQNNNIKRISGSIEKFCETAGLLCKGGEGYRFPKPGEVDLSIFDDKSLGFGYRAPFLKEIYEYAQNNPKWLENLKEMNYTDAYKCLLERKGIGPKVANCICLFGLHHVEAFPIDTHVRQLLDKYYPNGFNHEYFSGVSGIIQQFLFYYEIID